MRLFASLILLLLTACSGRIIAPLVPDALDVGTPQTVFVATNRAQIEDGHFGYGRSNELQMMRMLVSVPPNRTIGSISDGQESPNPERDFALVQRDLYASVNAFQSGLRASLAKSEDKEIIIYIHGYNNSFADPAFRMAQLSHDLHLNGPVISFAWPSRASALGYQYDTDSTLFSRDALAEVLLTAQKAGASRLVLVAHSLGSALTVETLRQIELVKPGWAAKSMAGVILISPDINVDVFRSQTNVFTEWPQPFVVFASQNDTALRLSGQLRGEDRQLGKLSDISEISDLPISFVDVSAFSDGDRPNHFVAGSSASFIKLLTSSNELDQAFLRGQTHKVGGLFGASRVIGEAETFVPTPDTR